MHGSLSHEGFGLLCRIGTFVVEGKIKRARVSGVDTSRIYLKGVVNSVEASLSGVTKLYIVSASSKALGSRTVMQLP